MNAKSGRLAAILYGLQATCTPAKFSWVRKPPMKEFESGSPIGCSEPELIIPYLPPQDQYLKASTFEVALWLHDQALRLVPYSDYARQCLARG